VTIRRMIDEDPRSIEAHLLRVGRAMQPPDSAYQKTLAGLGIAAATLASAKVVGASTTKVAFGSTLSGVAVKGIAVGVMLGASVLGATQVGSTWHGRVTSASAAAVRTSSKAQLRPKSAMEAPVAVAQTVVEREGSTPNAGTAEPTGGSPIPRPEREATGESVRTITPSPCASPNSLGAEVVLIDQIRRALDNAQAEHALDLLEQYRLRFPAPRLGEEASFLRVRSLARVGRSGEAAEALKEFKRNFPNSALAGPR